ncbi:MAG: allantoicase [Hoeflea sp.]|uniref:allantoicase n=1 Tax=Hoeflea sp. TaxID=1940281 RepID=UPI0032EEE4DF
MNEQTAAVPGFAVNSVNLASAGLGARGLSATDEFFAPLERMLADQPAVFIPDKYDDNGKWMDGWESRRKRVLGHDHAVIRLAVAGRIDGFDVDTSHFTGNYPPAARIEACNVSGEPDAATVWTEVLPTSPLGPDAHHYLASTSAEVFTHVRLHIYPDGGVARLRVFGQPYLDPARAGDGEIELSSSLKGGRIVGFSDAHYGSYHRLLAPGRGENMGDGWETSRRRVPGNEWIVIALGARGLISRAIVDTAYFKGNFPDSCSIQAADMSEFGADARDAIITASMFWPELIAPQKLQADHVHDLSDHIARIGPVTHVRLNIFPDGGVSRLKLSGRLA